MTRMSGLGLIAAVVLLIAPCASLAHSNAGAPPPPATNSAGTAQLPGPALNQQSGVTTGSAALGSGKAKPPATLNTDAAIQAENNLLDRKLKSICRGC